VAKQSIHNLKVVALNPSAGTGREKMAKIAMVMVGSYHTVAEPMTSDHQEKKVVQKV
jgi:hypothetical protein